MMRLAPLTFSNLLSVSVDAGGTGYEAGDVVTIASGIGAQAQVTSVNGLVTGPVTGIVLLSGGSGYLSTGANIATSGGSGSGLSVNTTTSFSDPAFSGADWVKQFILAPPFAWRWNRTGYSNFQTDPTFVTVAGQTDYKVSLPTFGWLEKATGYEVDNSYFPHEFQVSLNSASDNTASQPTRISTQYDDGEGNITFRLFPAPEQIYNVCIEYQNSASQFTSLTQTWSPIPDYLSYLFNTGFQAKGYEYTNDPRFQITMQLFMQQLISASEGLSETQKNLWMADKLNAMRETSKVQQGQR